MNSTIILQVTYDTHMMGTKHQKKVRNQQLQSAALRSVGVEETAGSTNPQKSVPQKAGLRVRVFIITYVERGHAWVFIIFFSRLLCRIRACHNYLLWNAVLIIKLAKKMKRRV